MLTVPCGSCGAKLVLPDGLGGKLCRCGRCGAVFAAPAVPDGSPQPASPAEEPPDPRESAEPGEAAGSPWWTTPWKRQVTRMLASRDTPGTRGVDRDELPGSVRRDLQPHRAWLLKPVGLASVLLGLLSGCLFLPAAVGLPLGITAWVVAGRDLARMRAGLMDPRGVEGTSRAREYAAVGAVLNLLTWALVGWFVFLTGSVYLILVRPGRW